MARPFEMGFGQSFKLSNIIHSISIHDETRAVLGTGDIEEPTDIWASL